MINSRTRSIKVGVFAGIPVKIHWTFGFIIVFIAYISYRDNLSLAGAGWMSITFLMLFTCVVLHEFGHALAARKYGIGTLDIMLTPIGGIARLKSAPQKPAHELVIAIAGPLVNLAIIILTSVYLFFSVDESLISGLQENYAIDSFQGLMFYLLIINVMLFSFNLVPAFPMDGGRVLRSLLSFRMNKLRATTIATIIGRIIAVIFVILSILFSNISLGIIGIFVYLMARQEFTSVKNQFRVENSFVKDLMRKDFHFFYTDDPIQKVLDVFNSTPEKSFLVYNVEHQLEGVLHELFLRQIKFQNPTEPIGMLVSQQFEYVQEDMRVQQVLEIMQKNGYSILPVTKDNQITGVVDRNDLLRFLYKKN